MARGEIKTAVERLLSKEAVVICDSLNYIKGFRYELFCRARSIGTLSCVVRQWVAVRVCRSLALFSRGFVLPRLSFRLISFWRVRRWVRSLRFGATPASSRVVCSMQIVLLPTSTAMHGMRGGQGLREGGSMSVSLAPHIPHVNAHFVLCDGAVSTICLADWRRRMPRSNGTSHCSQWRKRTSCLSRTCARSVSSLLLALRA